jgi:hypothetical protein
MPTPAIPRHARCVPAASAIAAPLQQLATHPQADPPAGGYLRAPLRSLCFRPLALPSAPVAALRPASAARHRDQLTSEPWENFPWSGQRAAMTVRMVPASAAVESPSLPQIRSRPIPENDV